MANLKTYTQAQLSEILRNHQHWLDKDVDGWAGMQANLSGANLAGAYLTGANLAGAYLTGANLYKANLSEANLARANLSEADLTGANLAGAYLARANLSEANLARANLSEADLNGANLTGADLFVPMACPDAGAFIGWKKARGQIVKLEITEDAKRSSATWRKCRCSKARVLEIQNMDGSKAEVCSVSSNRDRNFVYTVGAVVEVHDFDKNRWNECAAGIHFFVNRQEAVSYNG